MADVSGKFFSAVKVRTGVSPSSPGSLVGEPLEPVNPPGAGLSSVGITMPSAFAVANSPLTSNGTIQITGAGTIAQYVRGDGTLETFPSLTGFVPYTGATADVNLGTHDLTAERGTFANNGSSDTLTVNHTSGSGKGINVSKGGNGEALLVTKTSGSGNAMAVVGGRTALVDLSLSSVSNATGNFLTISGGVVHQRTPSETRSDVGAQAQLNGTGFVKASGTTISYDNSTYQVTSEKGQPNGYASLDSNGKVPLVQINDALIGNVNFQGLWNASTNTPTLANPPASGTKGYYYIVSTAGTFAGISFEVGDWIISDGTAWGKVDNTDAVSSVFGRTGNVTAANGDYTTAQVTESGNLYYTDGRARGALSFVAGSGAYNSSTGVITIPTNNNQITNGAGYITSAALGAYLPLTGGTLTGTLGGTSISLSGDITANRYRGVNSLVLNSYTTVNPSSNVYLYSPPNDRDAWIYLDSADTGSNWGIYHRQIDTAVAGLPANSIGFIGGGASGLQAWISLANGNGFFAGDLTANNLSGTNTGNVTIGTANGLSLSGQELSLGLASGSANGALSSTDWTTFNNKQAAGNYVTTDTTQTITGQKTISRNATSFNGTVQSFLIDGASGGGSLTINSASALYSYQTFAQGGVPKFEIGIVGTSNNGSLYINRNIQTGETGASIYIKKADGFVGINNIDPSFQLDVNGTGRFSGAYGGSPGLTVSGTTYGVFGANRGITNASSGVNYLSVGTQLWFSGIYENSDNFGVYSAGTGGFPLILNYGTGAATFSSSVTATSIIRSGGTSGQFLKADGSVDSNTYVTTDTTQTITGQKTFSLDIVVNEVNVGRGSGSIVENTILGNTALNSNTTGTRNTAIGYRSLRHNTTGSQNTSVGNISLRDNTTGTNNTSVGYASMGGSTTGNSNSAFGHSSLGGNTTGINNSALGLLALGTNTTGSNNTAIGFEAGYVTNGSFGNNTSTNSVYVGADTRASANGNTNEIVIGSGGRGQGSNSVVIGNTSITKTILNGNVLIGTTTDNGNILQVSGSGYGVISTNRGITNASTGMAYFSQNTQKWFSGIFENTDDFGFYTTSNGSFPLVIKHSNGNVLIGTTTDNGARLFVNGGDIGISQGNGLRLVAPNGVQYRVTVNNSGTLITTAI